MKKGLLLYTEEDYLKNREYAEKIIKYGQASGLLIETVLEKDLKYGIKEGKHFFCCNGIENIINFVINRTRNGFISEVLEALKIKVFNSSDVTKLCNDKNQTYLRVSKAGIKCLDTYIYTKESLGAKAKSEIDFPVILKKPFSHGGKDVYLCKTSMELAFILNKIDSRFVTVQQKLPNDTISDIRVYVVGGKAIGAIKRTAKREILANYSQGGEISVYRIDSVLQNLVDRLNRISMFDYVGFDFLIGEDGYYFNEIEDVAGSRSLYNLTHVDTAAEFIKHIDRNV